LAGDAVAGFCNANAMTLNVTLVEAANSVLLTARGEVGAAYEGLLAAAKAFPGLTAAAIEPAMQLLAAACHIWCKQLSTTKGIVAKRCREQQQQGEEQQQGQGQMRPLQPSQLPRQPFAVQPQAVAAAHEQLLQKVLGGALSLKYTALIQGLWDYPDLAQLARAVCSRTGAVLQTLAAAMWHFSLGPADAECEMQGLAPSVRFALQSSTIELIMEAMQLQHCCLRQAQQQEQQQREDEMSAHDDLLARLDWLLNASTCSKQAAESNGMGSCSQSWRGVQLLQLSMLQLQQPKVADKLAADAGQASSAQHWAGLKTHVATAAVERLFCATSAGKLSS
jgi:hypothetical protein